MNEMYEIKIVCENNIITTHIDFKPKVLGTLLSIIKNIIP